jgi:hypothetical protein
MGSEIIMPENEKTMLCEVSAAGADDIARVVLVHKNGETELADSSGGQNGMIFKAHTKILAGHGWYYIRLTQKDGNIAWSSPIFVTAQTIN